MKKLVLVFGLVIVAAMSMAQSDGRYLRRLNIRHADPQLIYLLLSGKSNFQTSPEISTLLLGNSFGNGGFGGSGFGGSNGGFNSGGNGGFSGRGGRSGSGNGPSGG